MTPGTEQEASEPLLQESGSSGLLPPCDSAVASQDLDTADSDPEIGESPKAPSEGGATWVATAAVMLAEMFGLGTLSIPSAFARLGWIAGLAVTAGNAAGMVFAGLLFSRLQQMVPRAKTFADYGTAAYGRRGRRAVYACVYSAMLFTPAIMQLVAVSSLQQILSGRTSSLAAGAIIAVAMIPLSQVQQLGESAWLAYSGTIGMLVGVGVVFAKLLALPERHHMAPVITTNPRASLVAVLDITFAYGGQVNWVRYMGAMRRKADFSKTTTLGSVFMTVIFMGIGLYGYHVLGTDFDFAQPVSAIFEQDAWVAVMNLGILTHCIIAYQIDLNVWTDMILNLFFKDFRSQEARLTSSGRRTWAMVSVVGILFSAVIAQVVPYFSLIVAIIAALGDVTSGWLFPALFVLKISHRSADDTDPTVGTGRVEPLPKWQAALCYLVVPLAAILSVAGLTSSIATLVSTLMGRS